VRGRSNTQIGNKQKSVIHLILKFVSMQVYYAKLSIIMHTEGQILTLSANHPWLKQTENKQQITFISI